MKLTEQRSFFSSFFECVCVCVCVKSAYSNFEFRCAIFLWFTSPLSGKLNNLMLVGSVTSEFENLGGCRVNLRWKRA